MVSAPSPNIAGHGLWCPIIADAKPIWEKFKGAFREGLGNIIDNKGLYCDPNIDRELDYGLFLIHTELLKEEVDHEDTPLLRYNLPKFANKDGVWTVTAKTLRDCEYSPAILTTRTSRRGARPRTRRRLLD